MKVFIIFGSLIFLSGCATIFQPGPNQIPVTSNPPGAKVFVDGRYVGNTPITVSVSHSDDGLLKFQKDGYETTTIPLHKVVSGTVFIDVGCNLAFWACFGVDLLTHAQGHYPEDPVAAEMTPLSLPKAASNGN